MASVNLKFSRTILNYIRIHEHILNLSNLKFGIVYVNDLKYVFY